MRTRTSLSITSFLFLLLAIPLPAQDEANDAMKTDFLNVYSYTSGKAAQLATAIPEDKFDWRPAEGVRSVKESVLHMAGANYFFGSMLGTAMPEGVDPRGFEKSGMTKDEAIATLNKSVEFAQQAVKNLSAEQANEKIDFFGNEVTRRQAMFILGDHAAEHLGQLIAYARSNDVVPPWSQKQE